MWLRRRGCQNPSCLYIHPATHHPLFIYLVQQAHHPSRARLHRFVPRASRTGCLVRVQLCVAHDQLPQLSCASLCQQPATRRRQNQRATRWRRGAGPGQRKAASAAMEEDKSGSMRPCAGEGESQRGNGHVQVHTPTYAASHGTSSRTHPTAGSTGRRRPLETASFRHYTLLCLDHSEADRWGRRPNTALDLCHTSLRLPYAGRQMGIAQRLTSGCFRDTNWGRGSGPARIDDENR